MKDADCVAFLQWALPRMKMRWAGFRKVRGQVCKRVQRRIRTLNLPDTEAYRTFLEANPPEWEVLDGLCRISISRFYRDRAVYGYLENRVLPDLAKKIAGEGGQTIKCWSAGCASGEEPYTLILLWHFSVRPEFPALKIEIIATEADPRLLRRAREACYPHSSLKDLPQDWLSKAFTRKETFYSLNPEHRHNVRWVHQDLREEAPDGPFHMVLCRNLAFTYYNSDLQGEVLQRIGQRLAAGGALVLGTHEIPPPGTTGFSPWQGNLPVYRKS